MPMRRSAVLLVLMFALVWQALALARPGSTVNLLDDAAHAALHLQGAGHHHDEDGGVRPDDSTAALMHALGDSVGSPTALPVKAPLGLTVRPGLAPGGASQRPPAAPFIEGPLRPPRLLA